MYPGISDGIVLTGFSTNASFTPFFAAGGDFQMANLNQPFRFGNASATMAQSILNMDRLNVSNPMIMSIVNTYGLTDFVAGLAPGSLPVPYVNGYIVNSNVNSQQYLFYLPGFFDTGLLYAGEMTKQPVTVGEILTLGSIPMVNAFAGPVLVVTGCKCPVPLPLKVMLIGAIAGDLPYCGGNCLATGDPEIPSIPSTVSKSFPKVSPENFEAYIQPNSGHGINFHYNATGAYDVIQTFLGSKGL